MFSRSKGIFAIGISLVASTVASAAEVPDSLKGAVLGMTLQEFRKLPYPEGDKSKVNAYTEYRVRCFGDPKQKDVVFDGNLPYDAPGVRACFHVGHTQPSAPGPKYAHAVPVGFGGLSGGEYGTVKQVTYHFFPPKDPNGRLIRISADIPPANYDHIFKVFTERFGQPRSIKDEIVENIFGMKFKNSAVAWGDDEFLVSVEQFSRDLDTTTVKWHHTKLSEAQKELDRRRSVEPKAKDDF